ncbi:hypothetical protein AMTRI_Chr02g212250 [Amborella trichopoda]
MEQHSGLKRRACTCSKDDFFPEESFKSWGNYMRALGKTPSRLKDRLLARSLDATEITEVRAQSQNDMKKSLNWWDLIWFGLGAVIGAGIFVLTGLEARQDAGPAVVISYVVSGLSALLSVFCYTEFAVEIPVAGGSFAYLRVELGDFVAFITAGNILFEYIVSNAAVARAWTSYLASLCNRSPDSFRITTSLAPDYNVLDPIAVAVILAVSLAALFSTKHSSRFNYIASIVHVIIILFVIIAGLIHAHPENLSEFAPYGARGIFKASAVLYFAYVGFDALATMAEETKNPARDIPIGLVGSMVTTTAIYCVLALTLCLMQPYNKIDPDAPFSIAFQAVGMDWAKYIVAFGALKGMTTVLLVAAVGQARYLTHIARTHMAPAWLALVHPKYRTPVNSTVVMGITSSVIALFTGLGVLANLLSLSTLFIFLMVALALLVRRYYVSGATTNSDRWKLIGFLIVILGSSVALSIVWSTGTNGWVGYTVAATSWLLGTLGLWVWVPMARKPQFWGTPLVPWLPSASIAINIFLLGSLDGASFVRFMIWTGCLLLYYVFFGLHASYDTAKAAEKNFVSQNLAEGDRVAAQIPSVVIES